MKKLTQEELDEVVRLHELKIAGDNNGVRAEFTDIDLSGLNFNFLVLQYARFINCLLIKASFRGANLEGAFFKDCCLQGINLSNSKLNGTAFTATNLVSANFSYADLTRTYFVGTDLTKANFTGTCLKNATFFNANLEGANLSKAELIEASFVGSNLTGVTISIKEIVPSEQVATNSVEKLSGRQAGGDIIEYCMKAMDIKLTMLAALLNVTESTLNDWRDILVDNRSSGKIARLNALYSVVYEAEQAGIKGGAILNLLNEPISEAEGERSLMFHIVDKPSNSLLMAAAAQVIEGFK